MSEERVRLFVALELPDEARDALVRWREPVLATVPGLRALKPADLHVTLCFLGWQSRSAIESVSAACAELLGVGRQWPPDLQLGEALWLPPRRPRVLAVELHEEGSRLSDRQHELSRTLESGGWYVPESRPFLAHVTVARARRGAVIRPVPLPKPPRMPFVASHITLFRSRLHPSGARYEPLASWSGGAQ